MTELTPRDGEPVVTKRRVSAMACTDRPPLLSALEVGTLVLCGLTTRGVVLSTGALTPKLRLRWMHRGGIGSR